jgi:hypothetical protein
VPVLASLRYFIMSSPVDRLFVVHEVRGDFLLLA